MPIDLRNLTKKLQDLGYPPEVYRSDPQAMAKLIEQAETGQLPRYGTGQSFNLLDSLGVQYPKTDRSGATSMRGGNEATREATRDAASTYRRPNEPPAPPTYGDIVGEQLDYYRGHAKPTYQGRLDTAENYRGEIDALADEWGQGQLDSSGYKGLGAARDEYMNTYNAGGLTDVTRANLEKSRREEDQWIRAQRESQLQDLAERGVAGSGAEVAGLMHDRAAAADRMSARDLDTHAFAQQQAMEALGNAADANRDIYGYDVDRLTGMRDYKSEGIAEQNDVMKGILDNETNVLNGLMENFVQQGANLESLSAGNVLPAAQSGSATITNAGENQGANMGKVIAGDTATGNQTGSDLGGLVGGVLPTPGPVQPQLGLGSGSAGGAAGEAALSTILDMAMKGGAAGKKPNDVNLQGSGGAAAGGG